MLRGAHAAGRAVRRHVADEYSSIAGELAHADAVAQDGAARIGTRRIDRDDADLAALGAQLFGQFANQRRLAAARHPGDADDMRAAGEPIDSAERLARFGFAMLGARDQPRHRGALAGDDPLDQIGR